MKTCVIYGDMASDRAGENYPTVNVCDACVEGHQAAEEDNRIVSVEAYDPDYGDVCYFCDTPADEE